MSNTLNLNAARAARAAARGEDTTLEFNEQTYVLVPELPLALVEYAGEGDFRSAIRCLLAHPDDDFDRLVKAGISMNDVMSIVEFYGQLLGESVKSAASSANTGAPSKPTGAGTTVVPFPGTSTEQEAPVTPFPSTPMGSPMATSSPEAEALTPGS